MAVIPGRSQGGGKQYRSVAQLQHVSQESCPAGFVEPAMLNARLVPTPQKGMFRDGESPTYWRQLDSSAVSQKRTGNRQSLRFRRHYLLDNLPGSIDFQTGQHVSETARRNLQFHLQKRHFPGDIYR